MSFLIRGILGAALGALTGAIIIGALTHLLQFESPIVGVLIGWWVGVLAFLGSGRQPGKLLGLASVFFTIVGILCARTFTVWLLLGSPPIAPSPFFKETYLENLGLQGRFGDVQYFREARRDFRLSEQDRVLASLDLQVSKRYTWFTALLNNLFTSCGLIISFVIGIGWSGLNGPTVGREANDRVGPQSSPTD
jgi:hypothetical protein